MIIKRNIIDSLKEWKGASNRKPVLLMGARQTGKTWVMETFGKEYFDYCAKFDFDRQPELKSVFKTSKNPDRILKELALFCTVPLIAGKTLIIFDEIQECEEALNSLKYFCEDAPMYHIIAAGSMLGVAVRKRHMTVPVGKVKVMKMTPVTFREFLYTSDPQTYEYVDSLNEATHLPEIILNKLILEYKRYLTCGGMPEAVVCMLENRGMQELEGTLQDILDLYELDFAKYAEAREIPRIHAIWHSLPAQLAKENKKFIYNIIKKGARSKDYEDALMWLEEAGMIQRVYNITKPGIPLSAYGQSDAFKVYACDCGLLRRLANLPSTVIMDPTSNYTEFKGSMTESAILQSLITKMINEIPHYWSSAGKAEIEFILQYDNEVIPIEVKAEKCISGRSLTVYNEMYHPQSRIRFSFQNLQYNNGLLSCPSPLAEWFDKFLPPHNRK